MASYNDVTGDKIQSRTNTKEFEDNFDRIFGKKNKVNETKKEEEWDEKRIDIIGSNGNVGYTPEQINGADAPKQGEEK